MTFCADCGTCAEGEQRFCLECGASLEQPAAPVAPIALQAPPPPPMVCPACASPLEEHDRFCQTCGTAASGSLTADMACSVCGAPARPGEAFCEACVTPAYQPQPVSYGAGWPAAEYQAYAQPPYGQPPDAPAARRGPRPWLVAGVAVAVLAAVSGAVATALVLAGDEEPVVAQVRPVTGEPRPVEDEAPESLPPGLEQEDAPSEPAPSQVPEGFFSEDSPATTMRTHWSYLADGDYAAAYDTFVASYSANRSRWIAGQEENGARVGDVQAATVSDDGQTAEVEVSVVTRDAGRGDRTCNRFSGLVRLEREGAVWQYDPRPPEDDPSYFQRRETGLSSSDFGCADTFD